ncbi:FAD-dependent oxidoreductase [Sphingomonas sp.]|uniref:NAD(P)/FAD-dependent oxidoreductase n=1 Tax=Sphingomonas sp. TaxID=28214 RepID=UPI0025D4CBF2|nr:FAD-dependent oxidoreductase [Sphingomonas sp.]
MIDHRVVVIGAGFAGLQAVKKLKGSTCSITLVDRRNHHLFQPLLYQAATSILAPTEIAWPIRQILKDRRDVSVVLGEVVAVDREGRTVMLDDGTSIPFDTLIVATGVSHAYFGHDEWRAYRLRPQPYGWAWMRTGRAARMSSPTSRLMVIPTSS